MKTLKIAFGMIIFFGLLSVSQALACEFPGMSAGSAKTATAPSASRSVTQSLIPDTSLKFFTRRDLVGRYASRSTATLFDPSTGRTQHATCVGVITFDGRGNIVDREVHSYDGFIVHDEFTGTYTMNSDGTGIMHLANEAESFDYSFVMSDDGKEVTFLVLLDVPGLVSDGVLKKQ
jgi:hypothetical protein